jgi:hypothetical protein
MTAFIDEAQIEIALVELFKGLGYEYAFELDIACDGPRPNRTSYAGGRRKYAVIASR